MLTIVREVKTNKAVLGRLYFCGKIICYTL